jgi:hypothetical protein
MYFRNIWYPMISKIASGVVAHGYTYDKLVIRHWWDNMK